MAPKAKYCDQPGNYGCTGIVGLETSHASIHCWTKPYFGRMDLYSCADYDETDVISHLADYLHLTGIRTQIIDRNPEPWELIEYDS